MEIGARTLAQVRQATALLEAASKALDEVTADDAVRCAEALARAEKVAMAATRRAVLVAGDRGARRHGGARDMAALAATLTGTSLSRAKKGLQTAERAGRRHDLESAYVTGSLSFDQAAVITDTSAVVPGAAADLLEAAGRSSLAGLRAASAAQLSAYRGEAAAQERERRLVARRFCRVGPLPSGGVRLEALLPSEEGASLLGALEKATDISWRRAWRNGEHHLTREMARADALVALVRGTGDRVNGSSAPELVVTVDAAALVRGVAGCGEVCSIEGVGPVPVATARGLMGEALLEICVKDAHDVRSLTSKSRVVPARVRSALSVRDPACVVPGCGVRHPLEIDHWRLDFSVGGLSAIDNLCRLCPAHHRLKTRTGWRLEGGPGRWRWQPPRRRPNPTVRAANAIRVPVLARE
jgi:hypothetical protein